VLPVLLAQVEAAIVGCEAENVLHFVWDKLQDGILEWLFKLVQDFFVLQLSAENKYFSFGDEEQRQGLVRLGPGYHEITANPIKVSLSLDDAPLVKGILVNRFRVARLEATFEDENLVECLLVFD